MIFDTLERLGSYGSLHPRIEDLGRFLETTDLGRLAVGRVEIAGDELFAIVGEDEGKGMEGARLEAHRKYIDVQIVLAGEDLFGWKPLAACSQPSCDYLPERDIRFFDDSPDFWLPLLPGTFAIFYPDDAHAPLAAKGAVRKIVFKLRVAGT